MARWVPLEDGEYQGNRDIEDGVVFEDCYVIVHGKTIEAYQEWCGQNREAIVQFDNIRLCRLVDDGLPVVKVTEDRVKALENLLAWYATVMGDDDDHATIWEILKEAKEATGGTATR